jgi:hypothetical protein
MNLYLTISGYNFLFPFFCQRYLYEIPFIRIEKKTARLTLPPEATERTKPGKTKQTKKQKTHTSMNKSASLTPVIRYLYEMFTVSSRHSYIDVCSKSQIRMS